MDETETEDEATGALPMGAPADRDAYMNRYFGVLGELQAAQARSEATRRQLFEQAEQRLQNQPNAFRFGSPEVTQALFGVANALVSPRQYGGFGGTMANVLPALSSGFRGITDAQRQREEQLRQLREQYQLGNATSEVQAAQGRLDALEPLARFYNQSGGQPIWSENLQRFIPRDRPVVVETGATADGGRAERYTDGTIRIYSADGTSALYDAGGNLIPEGGQ